jgi:hypothetical protein
LKRIRFVGGLALLASLFVLPALSGVRNAGLSTTRTFYIDGKTFRSDPVSGDINSSIRAELRRRGLDVPDLGFQNSGGIFNQGLLEDIGSTVNIDLPHGLHAEHAMHMESDSGHVELAVGILETSGTRTRRLLADSGWICLEAVPDITVLTKNQERKGTTIVFLEEKERRFLLIRRME